MQVRSQKPELSRRPRRRGQETHAPRSRLAIPSQPRGRALSRQIQSPEVSTLAAALTPTSLKPIPRPPESVLRHLPIQRHAGGHFAKKDLSQRPVQPDWAWLTNWSPRRRWV